MPLFMPPPGETGITTRCRLRPVAANRVWRRPAPAARRAPWQAPSHSRGFRSAGTAAPSDTRGCPRDRAASGNPASRAAGSRSDSPAPPARWATLVSTVITRSRQLTSAAVSAKSVICAVRSTISVRSSSALIVRSRVLLQADESRIDIENAGERPQCRRSVEVIFVGRAAGPNQADPQPGVGTEAIFQARTRSFAGGGR